MIETTVDGRYQIIARIAAGGMGEVYRAHDSVLDRDVALKVLHPTLSGDAAFIDRFRREARAAGMLGHPNIVAVHDWGRTGDTYFMVMEFVRGPNLRTLMMRNGTLQPGQAVEAVSQVLGALGHAHGQGIIHRDIKPENILVTPEGVAKVADFGLARALAESRVTTAPGTVTGTVQYLAPEQIQGESADPRTDLYATGILLFESLAGRVPFTGETSVAIAYKHLRERVPPPSKLNPMVPPSLDAVVLHATQRDRDRRIPDATTMREQLQTTLPDLPPAPSLKDVASEVPATEEAPADRAATVTIPRAVSPRAKRRKWLRRLIMAVTLVGMLAAAGWATWTYALPRIEVPDLRGKTVDAAMAEAESAELKLVVERQVFSPTVEAGGIINQTPPPGDNVRRDSEIAVVVSRGPELVTVPEVTGRRLNRAQAMLEEAKLEVRVTRDYHEEVEQGRVIDQNPSAGTTIEAGKVVELTVSRGKPPVEIPNVVGRSESDAADLLQAAGLGVEIRRRFSTDVDRGLVITQRPGPGTTVDRGATVTLVISRGPREFPMPNVIGKTRGGAIRQLEGLGLSVKVVQVPGSSGNTVVGQNPNRGETVEVGQEVTIYVGG